MGHLQLRVRRVVKWQGDWWRRYKFSTAPPGEKLGVRYKTGTVSRKLSHARRFTPDFIGWIEWRRGWDSNPRAPYGTRRFRGAPVTTTSVPLRSSGPFIIPSSVRGAECHVRCALPRAT